MIFLDNFVTIKQILAPALAFFISLYAMPIIIRVAIKKELVAKPNHRTSHKGRVPNVGGISIFLGFILAMLLASNINQLPTLQYFLLGLIGMFFLGLCDDILILSPRKKLLGEIVCVTAMVILGDFRITNLHGFMDIEEIGYVASVLLTIFTAIVIINAVNLIDGIDGLASGAGMIASLFFGICFLISGGTENIQLAILAFCLFGALIPFFLFNVFGVRNKIFMGDAGALSLGFILALLTISFCQNNISAASSIFNWGTAPIIAIAVLILPLFDTLRVFIIRALHGKSPFRPDKNHLHHNLLALGFTHKQATATLLTSNILFIAIALIANKLPGWILFAIIITLAVVLSEFIRYRLRCKQARERDLQINYNTSVHN